MRSSHRKALDRSALLSIVGTSVMTVVAGAHGFDDDEPDAEELSARAPRVAA